MSDKDFDEMEMLGFQQGRCPRCGRTVYTDTGFFECDACGIDEEDQFKCLGCGALQERDCICKEDLGV
jgi:hypothetical protein